MSTNTTSSGGSGGMIGWVPPDARRNTWDIILSCLSIFLVCSWKCVHLNPPTGEEARGEWHKVSIGLAKGGRWRWEVPIFPKLPLLRKWCRRLMWMGIISVAPELGVAVSVKEWKEARSDLKWMSRSGVHCTMPHAFLFNMGGVIIREVTKRNGVAELEPKRSAVEDGDYAERTARAAVTGVDQQVDYLAEIGHLELPGLMGIPTTDEITDRSKSDGFTKLFSLMQAGWLIVSSIARVCHGYAITELELATMAFIICAFVMYSFWWNKPFGIEQRWVLIRVVEPGDPSSLSRRIWEAHSGDQRIPELHWRDFFEITIVNSFVMFSDEVDIKTSDVYPTLALYLTGMVFSAIHVAAWNWEFPSRLIQILWRTSTMAAFGASFLPFICMPIVYIGNRVDYGLLDDTLNFSFVVLGSGLAGIYVIARLLILFLTFYCFTAMPSSVYEKVGWTGYLPHFS
ncbi:hypothetical protein QBC47DRAFT_389503 [Echria macrotheca]|uniref:Uncharacterized protein n=1 Tax=Echria macrotheca TaxID=438768 RepID=A0AAJ0F8D4_9PEZI|nr:hypothetical protein QBC47DRAFT_389503 [Echria macrotheca]